MIHPPSLPPVSEPHKPQPNECSSRRATSDHRPTDRPTDRPRGKLILSTKYCRRCRRVDRNDVMQISANNAACHRGGETEGGNDAMSKVRSRADGLRNGKKWPSISGPMGGRSLREGGREGGKRNHRESRRTLRSRSSRRPVDFDRRAGKAEGADGITYSS